MLQCIHFNHKKISFDSINVYSAPSRKSKHLINMFPNPSAQSFTPTSSLEFAIYNEGVPSMATSPHEVLQSISEEAIATCFPPTAEEVRYLLPYTLS